METRSKLSKRESELISIGASIAANCGSCLLFHIDAARAAGATETEMREAVTIGEKIKAEPASQLRQLSERLLARTEQVQVPSGNKKC